MRLMDSLCVVLLLTTSVPGIAAEQITLSLRQREEKDQVVLDILVSNVSTSPVEIVSEGRAPPWSVWAWFDWTVDGKSAKYFENVAMFIDKKETWQLPPNGTILWASIPLRELEVMTTDGLQRAIVDDNHHTVGVSSTERWGTLKVASGKIEVGKRDTEQTDREATSKTAPSAVPEASHP